MSSPQPPRKHTHPFINRSRKNRTFFNGLVFALSRLADVPLQYQILAYGLGTPLINALGSDTILSYPPSATHQGALTSFLGLSSYRTLLLSMSAGAALKHAAWAARIQQAETTPTQALGIALLNSFPSTLSRNSLFVTGIALEWVSEEQRKEFKDDPRNTGKVFSGGLFGRARHINYGGYMLWRAGFAVAAGGWKWGATVAALFGLFFEINAIPELDEYCTNRVGNKAFCFEL
ncbi:hypothetical protein V5O48_018478 [Marasmius crinis-equi]|uniref:Steroid 5-alpha reductase C-terminal domain-containing protein n=1 Tax=Marasmius crinis-equi TaxID=585013 RepID=A0ABR3EL33_9AGAR